VGTSFSQISGLWRARETSKKRASSRGSVVASPQLRAAMRAVEQRVQQASMQQAASVRETADASFRSIAQVQEELAEARQHQQAVQSQVASLAQGQQHQAASVASLAENVRQVRHDATQTGVATGLAVRTSQATLTQQLEERWEQKNRELCATIARLQDDIFSLRHEKNLQQDQIAGLQTSLHQEQNTVTDLREYLQNVESAMQPVVVPESEMDVDMPLRVSDIAGAVPTAYAMRNPSPAHVNLSASVTAALQSVPEAKPFLQPTSFPLSMMMSAPQSVHQPSTSAVGISVQPTVPTFASAQMRPREPLPFKGEMHEDLQAWLSLVRDYCHLTSATNAQSVSYAATLLHGNARVWWDSYLRAHHDVRPANLQELAAAMRERFLSPMFEKNARHQLWTMVQRQGETVHAYAARIQTLLQRLDRYDEADMTERFIRGLRSELRIPVAQREPDTLLDAVRAASHLELLAGTYGQRAGGQQQGAVGATSGGRQVQNFQGQQQSQQPRRGGRRGRGRGQGQQGRQGQQGQRSGFSSGPVFWCDFCGKKGHTADFCWSKPGGGGRSGGRFGGRRGSGRGSGGQFGGRGQQGRGGARLGSLAAVEEVPAGQHPQPASQGASVQENA
jgi:hypothetical protein